MLNKDGNRELAYLVVIDNITPIEGYDRVELAHVGGWTIVVGKGDLKVGDPAIYFEIDSKLPEVPPFSEMEFLAKKHYKIKTQRMCKSISQGLLLPVAAFGWEITEEGYVYNPNTGSCMFVNDETRFLTAELGVTYNDPADNIRKAPSADKYKKMAARHPNLFKKAPIRWLMRRNWGKKILFLLFGKKKDKRNWPQWVVKTDEERIENLPFLFNEDTHWIATEKIDGTSTTFTMKRGRRNEFYVCSRNVVMDTPDKKNYYSEINKNVYWEMAEKYKIKEVLSDLLKKYPEAEWITIQGETYGEGIQKHNYHINGHDFLAFNLIMSNTGRWNSIQMTNELLKYGIPCVPIVAEDYQLPSSLDELRAYVDSKTSVIDGDMREGIVFRSLDGIRSFKCVSPTYLLKYHG